MLNAGTSVVMLVGAGALRRARRGAARWPTCWGARSSRRCPARPSCPTGDPFDLGGIGLLGTAPAEEAMERCDTLFMVGTNFPYTKYLPEPGQAKVVQIEADPVRAGNRIATDVPLDRRRQGDARRARAPCSNARPTGAFLEGPRSRWRSGGRRWRRSSRIEADPIQPQHLMAVIDRLASRRCHLDLGLGDDRHLGGPPFRHPRERASSTCRATSPRWRPGLPYTIANQIAHPGRQCIAFVGDGGLAMLMAEFATACRYRLPVKVIVNNNASLGQILWEQLVLGYPEFGIRFEQRLDFAPWAEACGGLGIRVDKCDELEAAMADALSSRGTGPRRRHRQPRRAADAGEGHLRAGQGVREGVPGGTAEAGHDRQHAVPGQALPAKTVRAEALAVLT